MVKVGGSAASRQADPINVRPELESSDGATSGLLDLDGALSGDRAVAGDQTGQVGRSDPKNNGKALFATSRKALHVRRQVHGIYQLVHLPEMFTKQMYQVKVISLLGNKWCNGRMDIHDIRRQRLKQIIAETYSGNAAKLAMEAELSSSYLSRIFTSNPTHRRNIGEKLARSIEQKLGLNEGALDLPVYDSVLERTPEGFKVVPATPPAAQPNAEYVGMISVWDDDTPVEEDEVEVPFLREVELAAGTGKTYIEETSRWKLRFGKYTLRRKGVQPENAVCVVVRGNSMEPILPDGSTVGVDRGATNIVDGKVYALKDDGMLRVKTLYRLPGGMVRLRSYNRDEYSDEDRELESIEIIGRVFWSSVLW